VLVNSISSGRLAQSVDKCDAAYATALVW
jgi:hypothetical protein